MKDNVIAFDFSTRRSNTMHISSIATVGENGASVHTILEHSHISWVPHVYKKLQLERYSGYKDFFDALLQIRHVRVSYQGEPRISGSSLLIIEAPNGAEWTMDAEIFANITHQEKKTIDDDEITKHILSTLNSANIAFALRLDEDNNREGDVCKDIEEIERFDIVLKPAKEKINGRIIYSYDVAIGLGSLEEEGGYSSASNFEDPYSIPVFYVMLDAIQDMKNNGYTQTENMEVGVNRTTDKGEYLITMNYDRFLQEIDTAIKTSWPLYSNYSDSEKLREMVYERHVAPHLKDLPPPDDEEYE